MNQPHTIKTLFEPRPDWVRQFYGDKSVCACTRCGLVVAGVGVWWLGDCRPGLTVEDAA